MKIYPSPHQVRETAKPRFTDIPVAHIEKDYYPSRIDVIPEAGFQEDIHSFLAPYQEFSSGDMLLFDENSVPVKADIRYQNHRYVYIPDKMQEFTPETFTFSALIKRRDVLSSARDYNIRIGILNQDNAKDMASSLISIFGDAAYRGISPANISVNGRGTDPENLIQDNSENLDFLIISSVDGTTTKDERKTLDLDSLLATHCNLWITVTDDGISNLFSMEDKDKEYTTYHIMGMNGEITFSSKETQIKSSYGASVALGAEFTLLPRDSNYYLLDASSGRVPVLIIEKPDKGIVIISHENIFNADSLSDYSSYIYNILTIVYANSYIETDKKELWIADDIVDYMGSLDMAFRAKHPAANINDMILNKDPNIISYQILSYKMNSTNVIFDLLENNGNLHFRKLLRTDPVKGTDMVSVYTTQHTVMYYEESRIQQIESRISCMTEIDAQNRCFVSIEPFVSSEYRLRLSKAKRFEIPDIERIYGLYALPVNLDMESEIFLIEQEHWKDMGEAILLCKISVSFEGEPAAYDIRILGGGLPEKYTDYEMLDIGNLKGRPYRDGTGAVIVLPKAYEKYKDRIEESVNRYKIAADQFYFIFQA